MIIRNCIVYDIEPPTYSRGTVLSALVFGIGVGAMLELLLLWRFGAF